MSVPNIPSKINSYNVYNDAERLIGVGCLLYTSDAADD